MKVPEGCAICQSTWGNYWAEVEGQRMFFCCKLCETEFRNMIQEVKKRTGWKIIDEIQIAGGTRGRQCKALFSGKAYSYQIRFNSQGEIGDFHELAEKSSS